MFKLALAGLMAASSLAFANTTNPSDVVDVKVFPDRPIIFTAPLTYTNNAGKQITIQPPWTRFQIGMTVPKGMQPVTVIALNVQTTSNDLAGFVTNNDFNAANDSFTKDTGDVCNYTDYGQADPSGEMTMLGEVSENCPNLSPVFYVGYLPKTNDFNMKMMITPMGWFGTRTNPVDRFQRSVNVVTQ